MAKIEQEFMDRPNPRTGEFKAKPFLPRIKINDIGLDRIGGERFFTRKFMQAEWEHVWTKTWQLATRVDDLANPGAYFVHELGKESFIFVKGNDQVIRGFFNVCQHRGNRLWQSECGEIDHFTCPFHGWQWNIDGTLHKVADPQFFRQFADGVPHDELGLSPVQVDTWGGWLWFNMDPNAGPLREYLGEMAGHLESYEFEKFHLVDYQTFEWNGNWKHAVDAFNESYHFAALHPDMIEFGEGHDIPIELWGIHSRMLNFNNTVSEVVEDRDTITPLREEFALRGLGKHAADYQGSAKDIHLEEIRLRRLEEDESYLPFKQMNDEQLVHQYHYTFFPNTTFTHRPEGGVVFRYRPHASDPNKCYYDFLIMAHLPPGTTPPSTGLSLPRPAAARSRATPRTPRQSPRLGVMAISITGSSSPKSLAKDSPTGASAAMSMMPSCSSDRPISRSETSMPLEAWPRILPGFSTMSLPGI